VISAVALVISRPSSTTSCTLMVDLWTGILSPRIQQTTLVRTLPDLTPYFVSLSLSAFAVLTLGLGVNKSKCSADVLFTDTWLLYNDLSSVSSGGEPQLYANLSKNGTIPDMVGGVLWEDNINKRFYLFGGEYYQTPAVTFNLLSYDVLNNYWVSFGPPSTATIAPAWGAGLAISERGEGYYYGGWNSNTTTPGYTGDPTVVSSLIIYEMDTNSWTTNAGPDSIGRAEGVMVYLPASDRGLLIYFGGISQNNGTAAGDPMDIITIYDIASSKWYTQTATGDVPEMRRRFCAGATWAPDRSSYNM
jgi:hypothetical protein